jgi:RNA polymerase sigma factor (sigma-70 family)
MARRARSLRPAPARALSLHGQDQAPPLPDPVDPRPLADEQLAQREQQRLTACALSALPPHWEQALRWKYTEELRVEEIARRMGLSPKATESLLSRARAAFRETYVQFLAANNGRAFMVEEHPDA